MYVCMYVHVRDFSVHAVGHNFGLILMKSPRIDDTTTGKSCIVFEANQPTREGTEVTEFRELLKRKDLSINFAETQQIDRVASGREFLEVWIKSAH